jgi:hypothetical protein
MQVKSFHFPMLIDDNQVNQFISGKKVLDIKLSSIVWMEGSNRHKEHAVLVLYE